MSTITTALKWFYDSSAFRCREELRRFFDMTDEDIYKAINDKDYHTLYDDDKLTEDMPNILFYEQAKSCAISEIIQEAFNSRYRLKTKMTLRSIAQRHTKDFNELKILEYGAGTGWIALPLAFLGAQMDVFEFGHMAEVIRYRRASHNIKNLEIYHPYLCAIPMREKYDIIISYEVMEHIHDPLSKIVEFNRALKYGGLLYLTYSFGVSPCSQHLEENQKYHGNFELRVAKLGFNPEFERENLELDFPVHIFRKDYLI